MKIQIELLAKVKEKIKSLERKTGVEQKCPIVEWKTRVIKTNKKKRESFTNRKNANTWKETLDGKE